MDNLEKNIHNLIFSISDFCLTGDNKIVNKFGNCAFGIDHFMILDNNIITIQDKWENKSPCIRDIRHFIGATNYIKNYVSQNLILALFVSKNKITKRGLEILQEENNKYPYNIFYSINNYKSINELAKIVYNFIIQYLFKLGINIKNNKDTKLELFEYQKNTINVFIEHYLNKNIKSGIVSLPTGSGKTFVALSIINEFWEKYPNKSVLWITERKDILHSQFDNNKLDIAINSGFIQNYSFFHILYWYNNKSNIEYLNQIMVNHKPIFLITNIDSIIYDNRYKNIKNHFGLIILDECHSAGAEYTYCMLDYFKNIWNPYIIGFSATPIRTENKKFIRIASLFGDGYNINFISRMTLIDAIDQNIIIPPEFYWIETNVDKIISYKQFISNIDYDKYSDIIKYIEVILKKSITKKAISWAQTINNADEWYLILKRCQQDKNIYPILSQFKIFISHTGKNIKNNNHIQKFMLYDDPALLICVGQCREGFDDPKIDTGINLDAVQNRGTIIFIQETGRTLRKYKNKQKGLIMDTFTFINEDNKIEQICNMIVGYCLFLKQIDIKINNLDVSKEYNELIKNIKINIPKKYISLITPKGKEILFNINSTSLKCIDWNNLPKELIKKIEQQFFQNGISYETAKNIIKEFYKKIISKEDYYQLCDIDTRLPKDPELVFKGQFINWIDYLSINKIYYDLETCQSKIIEYINQITNYNNLNIADLCQKLCLLDDMFPPNGLWVEYYKCYNHNIQKLDNIIILKSQIKKKLNNMIS